MSDRSMDQGLDDAQEEAKAPRVYVFDIAPPVPAAAKCRLCQGPDGKPRSWEDLDGVTKVEYVCDPCEKVAEEAKTLLGKGMPLTATVVLAGATLDPKS